MDGSEQLITLAIAGALALAGLWWIHRITQDIEDN
jgi:hypothetical protein